MKKFHSFNFVLMVFISTVFSIIWHAEAFAGEVNFDDTPPSVDQVVQALKPDPVPEMKLRGINYNPAPPAPKMVSITLEFEKNSAELTPKTQKSLSMVGQALRSDDLKQLSFTLEGYADASGTAEHNLALSQKRAASVKKFLVDNYNVNPENLKAVGKGEQEFLDQNNPYSPKNRRVRIVTVQ
ncbi:MAG: OmpA family protein [Desulfobacteraceae bacterium]|nr:MAG: OmpA family protein [Desulfobacteraceae bacterium]